LEPNFVPSQVVIIGGSESLLNSNLGGKKRGEWSKWSKWRMENGEWRMENGEWRMEKSEGLPISVCVCYEGWGKCDW
jgi:hypothetical protein